MEEPPLQPTKRDAILGCVLGTAVGDALGLPFENLSPRRRQKLFGEVGEYRFLFGRGMGSDDTEHLCHTVRALIAARGDVNHFRRGLARGLRAWFLCLPAGIGKATAIACIKLLLGVSPTHSGTRSAGNGPAMRSAILGVVYTDDPQRLREFVSASTRLTHTDPLAETGALLVALAAGTRGDHSAFLAAAREAIASEPRWVTAMERLQESILRGQPTREFAASLGLQRGVTGYILHTVPVALHAALTAGSVREAVVAAVDCGGDTDTVGAIAGAVAGARLGSASIPKQWLDRWVDLPISISYLNELARALADQMEGHPVAAPSFRWWQVPARNLLFLAVVLCHVARRVLPPY